MNALIKSFPLNPRQNFRQELTLSTIQQRLSYKHEVSFTTPHVLEFYALVLVNEGEYRHVLDFKEYHIKAGDLFLISPNQIHYFLDLEGFDGYIITFSENFLKDYFIQFNPTIRYELLYEFYVVKKITLEDFTREQFIRTYYLLLSELKRDFDPNQKTILQNLLSVVLHNICREFRKENLISKIELNNTYIDFKDALSKKINYKYNVKYYADELKVSVRALQMITKKHTNKTPKELIDDNLILECKRQLLNTNTLIQDAAFNLGFDDPSAFTKYFKKNAGLTPNEFKKIYVL